MHQKILRYLRTGNPHRSNEYASGCPHTNALSFLHLIGFTVVQRMFENKNIFALSVLLLMHQKILRYLRTGNPHRSNEYASGWLPPKAQHSLVLRPFYALVLQSPKESLKFFYVCNVSKIASLFDGQPMCLLTTL